MYRILVVQYDFTKDCHKFGFWTGLYPEDFHNDTMIQFILSKVTYYKFVALESSYKTVPLDRPPVEGNPCRAGDLINIK